ncbi:MAG: hypothetical protein ACPHYE_02845, partial [Henriciella sp.]
ALMNWALDLSDSLAMKHDTPRLTAVPITTATNADTLIVSGNRVGHHKQSQNVGAERPAVPRCKAS